MTAREWRIRIGGWRTAPITANQRHHWAKKAKLVAQVRELGEIVVRAHRVPELPRVEVLLVWTVNTRARRDVDNIVPTLKALCDGIVDAQVVPDDIPFYMRKLMPEIVYEQGSTPHFDLILRELPEEVEAA